MQKTTTGLEKRDSIPSKMGEKSYFQFTVRKGGGYRKSRGIS